MNDGAQQYEDDYEDDEEIAYAPDDYCGECHRPAIGDHCQQCGLPLCPMCSETGAGFCKEHPDEHFGEIWQEIERLDLEAIEARCEAARLEGEQLQELFTVARAWRIRRDTFISMRSSIHPGPRYQALGAPAQEVRNAEAAFWSILAELELEEAKEKKNG